MPILDPHIHMLSRTTDDYRAMAAHGIVAVIEPAFWLGSERRHPATHFDYFEHLLGFEGTRAAKYGIRHFVCLSMNPKEANNRSVALEVLAKLPEYLQRDRVVGVGEIGFDKITDTEEEMLQRQMEIGLKLNMPLLVHTSHVNKLKSVERTLKVVDKVKAPPRQVLLDHNNEETMETAYRSGCWCGMTVYPVTKLSPDRAVALMKKYGTDRMMVNSSADWGHSDPLSVPKVIDRMYAEGFTEADVRKVTWENPRAFYGQSPKFSTEGL